MSKLFVFRCKPGKFPDTIQVDYNQSDLDLMQEMLDTEKAYGRIYINRSRKTGSPYAEVQDLGHPQRERQSTEADEPAISPGANAENETREDELPF